MVPQFHNNLLSIPRLCSDTNGLVFFSNKACMLQAPSQKRPLVLGNLLDGLYLLKNNVFVSSSKATSNSVFHSPINVSKCNASASSTIWHHRLGHLPLSKLKKLSMFTSLHSDLLEPWKFVLKLDSIGCLFLKVSLKLLSYLI